MLGSVGTLAISTFTCLIAFLILLRGEGQYQWLITQWGEIDFSLILATSPLRTFILMFAMVFGLLIALYSLDPATLGIQRVGEYYGAILITIGATAGILLSDHLLFLLIFWEIVTVSLYLLITTGRSDSNFAATKTFAMLGASDGALLLGVLLIGQPEGTFIISQIHMATDTPWSITAHGGCHHKGRGPAFAYLDSYEW
jgi:multicomponent K+:H+ antiporter subunit A